MQENERRPIPGHSDYEITPNGDVYRVKGYLKKPEGYERKLSHQLHPVRKNGMAPSMDNAYVYVTVTKDFINDTGDVTTSYGCSPIGVHRLVAVTFIGPPPEGKPWVNHKDGNKKNNHFLNLEWTSPSENIQHKYDTGLYKAPTGVDHWRHGTKHSAKTKSAQADAKTGEKHPKFKGWFAFNGIKYPSARAAAKATGVDHTKLKLMTMLYDSGWTFEPKPVSI